MVGVRSSSRSDAGLMAKPISTSSVRMLSISGWSHSAIDTRPACFEYGVARFASSRILSFGNARTGR